MCRGSEQWLEIGRVVSVGMVVIGSEGGIRFRFGPLVNVRELIGLDDAVLLHI